MSTKGRKWKPGQLEKFRATMAEKAKANKAKKKVVSAKRKVVKPKSGIKVGSTLDAIVLLEHASDYIHGQLSTGRLKKMDRAHNLAMLALSTLRGE